MEIIWTRSHRLALIASMTMAAAFILHYARTPLVADALLYQIYAFRGREAGLFEDFGTLRTYGYPLFLSWLTYLSGLDHLRLSALAGITQYGAYLLASLALVRAAAAISPRLATAVFIGLLLNPYLVAQTADVLTEGPTIALFVATVAFTLFASQAATMRSFVLHVTASAFLVAFALMIRPANLIIVAAWHLAMMVALLTLPQWKERRVARSIAYAGASVLAALVVWGPQAYYNYSFAGRLEFPLVCKLGEFQLMWGVALWRYETLLGVRDAIPLYFPNPYYDGVMPAGGWPWYLANPWAGVVTVLMHLFNGFDVNHVTTYVPESSRILSIPLRPLYWAAAIFGTYQLASVVCSRASWRSGSHLRRNTALASYLALTVGGTLAVIAISAVEVRFNVVPIGILSVAACYCLLGVPARGDAISPLWLAVITSVIVICVVVSMGVDRLGTRTLKAGVPFDLAKSGCLYSIDGDPARWRQWRLAHRSKFSNARMAPL